MRMMFVDSSKPSGRSRGDGNSTSAARWSVLWTVLVVTAVDVVVYLIGHWILRIW